MGVVAEEAVAALPAGEAAERAAGFEPPEEELVPVPEGPGASAVAASAAGVPTC